MHKDKTLANYETYNKWFVNKGALKHTRKIKDIQVFLSLISRNEIPTEISLLCSPHFSGKQIKALETYYFRKKLN